MMAKVLISTMDAHMKDLMGCSVSKPPEGIDVKYNCTNCVNLAANRIKNRNVDLYIV